MAQQRNRDGRIPLHHAAFENRGDEIRRLISDGADVNAQDKAGYTPLHFAAQEYSVAAAEALVRVGARVEIYDKYGNGPLWTAVFNSKGRGETIRLLRAAGADPLKKN